VKRGGEFQRRAATPLEIATSLHFEMDVRHVDIYGHSVRGSHGAAAMPSPDSNPTLCVVNV